MADCFITRRGGGGSGGLNFEVVGNPKPTNPKENTVWIDTDEEITSWVFSSTEPETPTEGMVWAKTGESGAVEFDVLKKNSIYIFPLFAKQYISGVWVDVAAKIYQNGAWVDWTLFLYNKGNIFEPLTGGWEMVRHAEYSYGEVEFRNDSIKLTGGHGCPSMFTIKKIDLSDANTLWVNVTEFNGFGRMYATSEYTSKNSGNAAQVDIWEVGLHQLDVSGLDGSYYVAIMSDGVGNGGFYIAFDSVWLE